jgi:hypothetical protein
MGPLEPDGAWKDFRDDLYWETLRSTARTIVHLIQDGLSHPGRGSELVAHRAMQGLVQLPQESRGAHLRWERSRWRHSSVDPSSPGRPHVEHPWCKATTKALLRQLVSGGGERLAERAAQVLDARMDTVLLPGQRDLGRWGVLESSGADGILVRYSHCAAQGGLIDRLTGARLTPSDLIAIEAERRGRVDAALRPLGGAHGG